MGLVTFFDLADELVKFKPFNDRLNALKDAINGLLDRTNISARWIVNLMPVNFALDTASVGVTTKVFGLHIPAGMFSANAQVVGIGIDIAVAADETLTVVATVRTRADDAQVGVDLFNVDYAAATRTYVPIGPTGFTPATQYIRLNVTTNQAAFAIDSRCDLTMYVATELCDESELALPGPS